MQRRSVVLGLLIIGVVAFRVLVWPEVSPFHNKTTKSVGTEVFSVHPAIKKVDLFENTKKGHILFYYNADTDCTACMNGFEHIGALKEMYPDCDVKLVIRGREADESWGVLSSLLRLEPSDVFCDPEENIARMFKVSDISCLLFLDEAGGLIGLDGHPVDANPLRRHKEIIDSL